MFPLFFVFFFLLLFFPACFLPVVAFSVSHACSEDGTRTLQRFEIFDEDGKYVRVDDQKGAISVCGELMPTTAGKKLNPGTATFAAFSEPVMASSLSLDRFFFPVFFFRSHASPQMRNA